MSIESSYNYRADAEGAESTPESGEYPIRSHHVRNDRLLIEKLLTIEPSEDSFRIVSETTAENNVKRAEALDLEPSSRRLDREWYGYGESKGAPISYVADVIASNRAGHIRASAIDNRNFLTFPDEMPSIIGGIIDNKCKACFFGGGEGGFHCRTVLSGYENDDAQILINDTEAYLQLPAIKLRVKRNPEKYQWTHELVPVQKPLKVKQLSQNDGELVWQIKMPLGLVRDVMTYALTRYGDTKYLSFQEMLSARGIPPRQNRVML